MNQYGVLIDQDMVRNALQTDGAEVRDLLTVKMALTVLLLGVLPCWLLWKLPVEYRPGWRRLGRRLAHLGIATWRWRRLPRWAIRTLPRCFATTANCAWRWPR